MWPPAKRRARRLGAPQSPLIQPCGPPSPLGGEGLLGAFYRLPPLGGKLSSEARLMRGLTVEGREIFRPRARYFPWMESTQRSPGRRPHKVRFTRNTQAWAFLVRSLARPLPTTTLGRGWVPGGSAPYDFRTRGARLENGLNLFGAGMNLGPLRLPPAAARAGQVRRSFFPHIAPLVCLAFPNLFGRGAYHAPGGHRGGPGNVGRRLCMVYTLNRFLGNRPGK